MQHPRELTVSQFTRNPHKHVFQGQVEEEDDNRHPFQEDSHFNNKKKRTDAHFKEAEKGKAQKLMKVNTIKGSFF